mgnify:CR=1 FL=1
MTEINIILDTDFEEDLNKDIAINAKLIFYQNLDQKLHIYLYNDYNIDKIDYNGILLDLIDNDNYLEQFQEININNIQINAIGPTPIETDLIKAVPQNKIQELLNKQSIKKLGTYEDVLNVINFFISPLSNMITGQIIYLGGV